MGGSIIVIEDLTQKLCESDSKIIQLEDELLSKENQIEILHLNLKKS